MRGTARKTEKRDRGGERQIVCERNRETEKRDRGEETDSVVYERNTGRHREG